MPLRAELDLGVHDANGKTPIIADTRYGARCKKLSIIRELTLLPYINPQ